MVIPAKDITVKAVSGGKITQADSTPDPFPITPVNVPAGGTAVSNTFFVTGVDSFAEMTISVDIGTYSLNGNLHTAVPGTMTAADTVELQHTAGGVGAQVIQTVTIGGTQSQFISTATAVQQPEWNYTYGINPNWLWQNTSSEQPLLNLAKEGICSIDLPPDNFGLDPVTLYPIGTANFSMALVHGANAALRSGTYYLRWAGTADVILTNGGFSGGSAETNGAEFTKLTTSVLADGRTQKTYTVSGTDLSLTASGGTLTDANGGLEVFHEDDLARADAGFIISQRWLNAFGGMRIMRSLNTSVVQGAGVEPETLRIAEPMTFNANYNYRGELSPEYQARWANEAGVEALWYCFGHKGNAARKQEEGLRLFNTLDSNIELWDEYGNEAWNRGHFGFPPNAVGLYWADGGRWTEFGQAPYQYANITNYGDDDLFVCRGQVNPAISSGSAVAHGLNAGDQIRTFTTEHNGDGYFTTGRRAVVLSTDLTLTEFRIEGSNGGNGSNLGRSVNTTVAKQLLYKVEKEDAFRPTTDHNGAQYRKKAEGEVELRAALEVNWPRNRLKHIGAGHVSNPFHWNTMVTWGGSDWRDNMDYMCISYYWGFPDSQSEWQSALGITNSWINTTDAERKQIWEWLGSDAAAYEAANGRLHDIKFQGGAEMNHIHWLNTIIKPFNPDCELILYEYDSNLTDSSRDRTWQTSGNYDEFYAFMIQHYADLGFVAGCHFKGMDWSSTLLSGLAPNYSNINNVKKYAAAKAILVAGGVNKTP
jgi:hypothetical protein